MSKFHEDWAKNVSSRLFTCFHYILKHIIGTNLLTKFQEDQKINLYSEKCPAPGSHVFQPTGIVFEHFQYITGMNHLIKFHEDRTVNVASRVLTRFYYSRIRKNAPPLGSHVFQANIIIFELIQYIIETNLLTKFHEDWTINVASREKCPATGGHVFKATKTIFKLIQHIIGTNLQTKFHDDSQINLTSRWPCFLPIQTIFELNRHIQKTHILTKFHEHWTKNVTSEENCLAPWQPYINETNVLTKFHDDWAKIVTSRVFTRNISPPPGGHVFQRTGTLHEDWASNVTFTVFTSFELSRSINETNVLTKFHEDQTINVASRVFTRQNVDDRRRTTDKRRSQKLTMCFAQIYKRARIYAHRKK
ncbi:hypothetical protein DPMN_090720 [Dreissena polymorpha]|uniref:Uncharacterized protein n=1 Tax=Dreissena polymorpha TaxID=45954 RepID=A0A9D4KZ94_DREPO|nr:hypothetical protein DPMN_090720 [Dreissena polymorpha]